MPRPLALLGRVDWLLVVPPLLLSLFGLAAIGSVGLAHDPPSFLTVTKQAVALAVGLLFAFALAATNYRALDHYARPLYLAALALLAAVLVFGRTVNGTKGWFFFAGWGFQPVEFAKLALVLILARFMSAHAHLKDLPSLIRSAVVVGLLTFLVLLQPDLGGAFILLGIWSVLLLIAGARRRHLLTLIGVLVATAAVAWLFVLQDYQRDRIRTFLDPSREPLGRGYNIRQATIAIGSGGLFGRGLGFGSQSQLRFLPEAQSDFVFAVIGEELGFAAVFVIFALFLLFFLRTVQVARRCGDNFSLFLTVGLATHVFLAAAVNIGVNLGFLPVTGIALPFLSAGGTSLVVAWMAVGILQSIAMRSESRQSLLTEDAAGVTIGL